MVYDEGFEVNVGTIRFFAFSNFELNTPHHASVLELDLLEEKDKSVSICNETQVGWYENTLTNEYGCFIGMQVPRENTVELAQIPVERPVLTEAYHAKLDLAQTQAIVDDLNAGETTWEARVYDRFVGKSMEEINTMGGLPRHDKVSIRAELLQGGGSASFLKSRRAVSQVDENLPKSLDWRNFSGHNYLDPVIDQGDCGSCYVVSTVRMFSARNRVARKDPDLEPFSITFPLYCSEFNQGCGGGYPFLVAKWSHELQLVPESCGQYDTDEQTCRVSCSEDQMGSAHVGSFGYVGGYYGAGEENGMLTALQDGPVVVSLEPGNDFMYYSKGIYRKKSVPHSEWMKVDHSILLVGYGSEMVRGKEEKYWVVQNSWGDEWGEGGFIRMARGENESGVEAEAIEAMVEARTKKPDLPFLTAFNA